MRPDFQLHPVNGPFADPALFVDVLFDRQLRNRLGRARPLALFGPAGFIEQVLVREARTAFRGGSA